MFYRNGKKKGVTQAKPLKDLIRIVTPELLLTDDKRGLLLRQIRDAFMMEDSRFESLCLSLIHQVINYCQSLPETLNSYYSEPPGLLDHALQRADAALQLFGQYLILEEKNALSEEQKLWQYALFSAAMVQGIGKLYLDFVIDIYDNNGNFLKSWNPLLESLALPGCYYEYRFQKESDVEFRRRLNLLLARALLPAVGFSWIASHPEVLATWLALINEDFYAAGTLGAILSRADAIALQQYFNQFLVRSQSSRGARYGGMGTFIGGSSDIGELEQKMGIEFLQWIEKSLGSGKLAINKSPLMLVSEGLLLTEELFQEFARSQKDSRSWQAVRNAFLSLHLHQESADGSYISRFEQNNNQKMHSGVVLLEYAVVLPPEVHFYNLVTGKSIPISATELLYQSQFDSVFTRQQRAIIGSSLQSLNKAGQWQKIPMVLEPTVKPLFPGGKHGG